MAIDHVFVLMFENRSFDHMLGFSGIAGIDGVIGSESNSASGVAYPVNQPAAFALDFDPGHGFRDVLEQLCGSAAVYQPGARYPPIDNSGFAANAGRNPAGNGARDAAAVMASLSSEQLPVTNFLAREFVVCDHWFASLPGPTWPNRLFVHAATSGGLDDSPSPLQSLDALLQGYRFANGTIFDCLERHGHKWSVVEGDAFPHALSLGGMIQHSIDGHGHFTDMPTFLSRIADPAFEDAYTFIEPNYGHVLADGRNFKCGNSQHPLDDVSRGEGLLKTVYEAIRSSPHWSQSLLVVMYDEHGGFYDHVPPPAAVPPGDPPIRGLNQHGFGFDQLGVRIPALVITPFTERGVVSKEVYDHASVLATVEQLFGLEALTARDKAANSLAPLLTRSNARDDAPTRVPTPADSGIPDCEDPDAGVIAGQLENLSGSFAGSLEPALVGFLHVAIARQLQFAASVDGNFDRAVAREGKRLKQVFTGITTKFDAVKLLNEVEVAYRHWLRRS
jgi:phospholipase C